MFVGGVKPETTDDVIKGIISQNRRIFEKLFLAYFEQFGEVDEVARPINKETQENKPFCFIVFKRDGIIAECMKSKLHRSDF